MSARRDSDHGPLGFAVCLAVLSGSCHAPEPVLERVEPPRGLIDRDMSVVLSGHGFDPLLEEMGDSVRARAWEIDIGGMPLERIAWRSPERIEAVVPAGLAPGTHDVVLRGGAREVVRVGGYTAVAPAAPRLDRSEPDRVPSSGGVVRLRGVGLHWGTAVSVRGQPVETTWRDDETLEVGVPPGSAGPADVLATTPVGRASRNDVLFYLP